ncbi:MAG: hypothetical protein OXI83_08960 [Gemmatimonadota bacterium]|nr:hypothetical protein [Gemmatimonadota bacterium]
MTKEVTGMHAAQGDAMEMRARAQRYTGPSAGRIARLVPHQVSFERGWFRTTTAVCHDGDEPDGLAFRQRPDGNGVDVRCHTGGCTRGHIVTALEGVIGLPIWTAYEPLEETAAGAPRRRWSRRRLALVAGAALLLAAPLLLGGGPEAALGNVAAFGVVGVLLAGLPGRARRAFRP